MGLDDELEARVGLGRSDYSQADHFARRAASGELSDFEHRWGASSNLFFDTYRPSGLPSLREEWRKLLAPSRPDGRGGVA